MQDWSWHDIIVTSYSKVFHAKVYPDQVLQDVREYHYYLIND